MSDELRRNLDTAYRHAGWLAPSDALLLRHERDQARAERDALREMVRRANLHIDPAVDERGPLLSGYGVGLAFVTPEQGKRFRALIIAARDALLDPEDGER